MNFLFIGNRNCLIIITKKCISFLFTPKTHIRVSLEVACVSNPDLSNSFYSTCYPSNVQLQKCVSAILKIKVNILFLTINFFKFSKFNWSNYCSAPTWNNFLRVCCTSKCHCSNWRKIIKIYKCIINIIHFIVNK